MANNIIAQFTKDPNAVLDFEWDWSAWLGSGETITSATVTPDGGITAGDVTQEGSMVISWVSGGAPGAFYKVACQVSTSAGRTDVRRIQIAVALR